MLRRFDDTVWGKFVRLWPIVIGIIMFIYGIGLTAAIVKNDHKTIQSLPSQITCLSEKDRELELRLVKIESAIQDLASMRDDIHIIARKMRDK